MLIKPEKVLKNKAHILEIVDLLVKLKQETYQKYPDISMDTVDWAIEQAMLRTSINDSYEFEDVV